MEDLCGLADVTTSSSIVGVLEMSTCRLDRGQGPKVRGHQPWMSPRP